MEEEKPEQCDCCRYETAELKPYMRLQNRDEIKWLCGLCAGTYTGTLLDYPGEQGDRYMVMQTVCYVGNVILAEIRAASRRP